MALLNNARFYDERAAIDYVQSVVWPNGPMCPRCGEKDRIGILKGKSTRLGVHKCYECRKPFTVRIGTIFEDSHAPLHLWLQAIVLIAGSKKGISANQLHRTLSVTLKTAWFMGHRIRLAMFQNDNSMMGEDGGYVEADETYFENIPGREIRRGHAHKNTAFALVERQSGHVRSVHVNDQTKFADIKAILFSNVSENATLMTDEARMYKNLGKAFTAHVTVNHSQGEYVRGKASTNTIENSFSVLKRGMKGTYQHCSENHLHRYLAEFDFRYNNRVKKEIEKREAAGEPTLVGTTKAGGDDTARAKRIISGVVGKRLTYRALKKKDA